MKTIMLFLTLLVLFPATGRGETVYEWTDKKGVLHFTDDIKNVPDAYRDNVRERDMGPSREPAQAAPGGSVPEPQTMPAPAAQETPAADLWGGHTGMWWRNRFEAVRSQIAALQNGLSVKETKLSEVRRQHRIFQRPRDRVAANQLAAELEQDQAKIVELRGALASLQQEADRAGLPVEWR